MRLVDEVLDLKLLDQEVNRGSLFATVLQCSHFQLVFDLSHPCSFLCDGLQGHLISLLLVPVGVGSQDGLLLDLPEHGGRTRPHALHIHLALQVEL